MPNPPNPITPPFTPTAPIALPNTQTTFIPTAPPPAAPFLPPNHTPDKSRVPGTGR